MIAPYLVSAAITGALPGLGPIAAILSQPGTDHMSSFAEDYDDATDPELSTAEQAPRPSNLGVDITGTREHKIVHAYGDLSAIGGDLAIALVARLLDDGCRRVRLDLADVRTVDLDGALSVRRLRSMVTQAGAGFWVTRASHLRLRRASPVGPA